MKKILSSALFAWMVTVVIFPPQANAYLDPGTGSYVIQVVAAVLFGSIFVIKTFWSRISMFLRAILGGKGKKDTSEPKHD